MSEIKIYNINRIKKESLFITGNTDNILWDEAIILKDLKAYWNKEAPSKTEFRALWDGVYLFFCFRISDSSIYIENSDSSYQSIGASDRVEIFLRSDKALNPYYCLEIDSSARLMDFKAYPNKKFDFNWSWPEEELIIKSNRTNIGYTVEGSISIRSLKALNLIKENRIEAGFFIAKYNKIGDTIYEPTWISWVNPKTEIPNFHVPSSFGILNLMTR